MAKQLDFTYPAILKNFGPHLIVGRTESRAFLGWFLEHYYRLDETEAQDAICDGPDDKGIDGVYVDSNLERLDVNGCQSLTTLFEHRAKITDELRPTAVRVLSKQMIPSYEKAIRRDRATSFSAEPGKASKARIPVVGLSVLSWGMSWIVTKVRFVQPAETASGRKPEFKLRHC